LAAVIGAALAATAGAAPLLAAPTVPSVTAVAVADDAGATALVAEARRVVFTATAPSTVDGSVPTTVAASAAANGLVDFAGAALFVAVFARPVGAAPVAAAGRVDLAPALPAGPFDPFTCFAGVDVAGADFADADFAGTVLAAAAFVGAFFAAATVRLPPAAAGEAWAGTAGR
jgi:hypothetical protein